mmetsp:Transcript_19757/g.46392  ORF Transcript_19757/g.46392 Transcript_19757/m.46392 type:complete len:98 (+) Transcript_19757:1196-1489(+)
MRMTVQTRVTGAECISGSVYSLPPGCARWQTILLGKEKHLHNIYGQATRTFLHHSGAMRHLDTKVTGHILGTNFHTVYCNGQRPSQNCYVNKKLLRT